MKRHAVLSLWIFFSVFLFSQTVFAENEARLSKGQSLYVPVYSHIYSGDKERPFQLTVTLSIRNTDLGGPITITGADFYDSGGKLIRKFVEKPRQMNPLESIRYVIGESDKKGGSGANFIVRWESKAPVNAPVVEAVMIGTQAQQGISFTSRARVIDEGGGGKGAGE